MKAIYKAGLLPAILFFSVVVKAQIPASELPTYRIGIIAPLYLDSVFKNNVFKYKQGMPKMMGPGLDFVQGALAALDSLDLPTANILAYVYDCKSYTKNIPWLISHQQLDSLNLIIGSVKDAELKQLADFSLQKNIPFISASFPNDGGVTNNPFMVIMSSTLKSHCEAIYAYLLQNHGTDKLFLCRRKNAADDRIAQYFKQINEREGSPLLKIQTLVTDSILTSDNLVKKLDSNRQNILIGASLDETFAYNLALGGNDLHESYPITLIGMPNWDGFNSIHKKDIMEEFPIYYTTPYFNNKNNDPSRMLISNYWKLYKGRPSDMAFKGFECIALFVNLLAKHPHDFMSNLNDHLNSGICDYNFMPVMNHKNDSLPDYFENKHVYFIRLLNGAITKAW